MCRIKEVGPNHLRGSDHTDPPQVAANRVEVGNNGLGATVQETNTWKTAMCQASRYQQDKREWERKRRGRAEGDDSRPEEPVRKWEVRDKNKLKLYELEVVRIDPLRVIVKIDNRLYAMGVGGYKRLELRGPTRTITSMKETIQWAKARLLGRSAS